MGIKNRNGKPTKFQLDALKALKADMKGIKTYRDAENAIKRLRNAKGKKVAPAVKKPVAKKGGVKAVKAPVAKPTVCTIKKALAKKDAADKLPKKAIKGTDEVRIQLPAVKVVKKTEPMHLAVELNVIHDDGIFTKEQLKKIDVLATFCQNELVKMCDAFAAINGLAEVKPTCSCCKAKAKKPCTCNKTAKAAKK